MVHARELKADKLPAFERVPRELPRDWEEGKPRPGGERAREPLCGRVHGYARVFQAFSLQARSPFAPLLPAGLGPRASAARPSVPRGGKTEARLARAAAHESLGAAPGPSRAAQGLPTGQFSSLFSNAQGFPVLGVSFSRGWRGVARAQEGRNVDRFAFRLAGLWR